MLSFLVTLLAVAFALVSPSSCGARIEGRNIIPGIDDVLGKVLSQGASIAPVTHLDRWSDFEAPKPGTIVTVDCEDDALLTLRYCIANNITFLVQAGGNGWATFDNCGSDALLIDLSRLKKISFCSKKNEVTVGGGVLISDLVGAAAERGLQVSAGNCNCISVIGAMLGGGLGRLQGEYGLMIDNVVSMNLLTPEGQAITVDSSREDLWFALRGAGPNFGVVTSATFKTYPVPKEKSGAWMGPLIFSEDKLEALVQAVEDLEVNSSMAMFLYFATKAPSYDPAIIAIPFYLNGGEEEGRKAFQSILDLGPVANMTAWTPYSDINTSSAQFCAKGGLKPSYGVILGQMDPNTWCQIWEEYKEFVKLAGTQDTLILMEKYSWTKVQELDDQSSSFAFRSTLKYNVGANLAYEDPALDDVAEAFGNKIRSMWRSTSGLTQPETYINYAHGDESPSTIYGCNTDTLRKLKKTYDPHGRFNQWFPLS